QGHELRRIGDLSWGRCRHEGPVPREGPDHPAGGGAPKSFWLHGLSNSKENFKPLRTLKNFGRFFQSLVVIVRGRAIGYSPVSSPLCPFHSLSSGPAVRPFPLSPPHPITRSCRIIAA